MKPRGGGRGMSAEKANAPSGLTVIGGQLVNRNHLSVAAMFISRASPEKAMPTSVVSRSGGSRGTEIIGYRIRRSARFMRLLAFCRVV